MKTDKEITLRPFGAAQTVTGSKHLLQIPELNILVDCGLFQGEKELRMKNREELPLPADEIDVVILTHAPLDHCGYLPLFRPQHCDLGRAHQTFGLRPRDFTVGADALVFLGGLAFGFLTSRVERFCPLAM